MMQFIFGQSTDTPDAQELARRRAITDRLLEQATAGTPRNLGEGLAAIGRALSGRIGSGRLEKPERAERERIAAMLAGTGGGAPMPAGAPPAGGMGGAAAPMRGPAAVPGGDSGIPTLMPASLIRTESGGNLAALNNIPGSGGVGHGGRGQFSHGRLADAARAGIIPAGMTPQQFAQQPEATQAAVENWHIQDIDRAIQERGFDRLIGTEINGVPVTLDGLRAVAHLGGIGGMTRFVESGGRHNPSDAFGTSLMAYFRTHGGGGMGRGGGGASPSVAQLSEILGNPYASEGQRAVAQALIGQAMQAQDPMRQMQLERAQLELEAVRNPQRDPFAGTQVINGQLVTIGPDGRPVVLGDFSRPDATSGMQEYNMAVSQGFQGSFLDYQMALAEARRSNTNVNVSTGSEIGTIPPGFELLTDQETGQRRMRAIPGGPQDQTSASAAAAAQQSLDLMDAILRNENLGSVTGMIPGRLPARTQAQQDLLVQIEQLQGQAFMLAFETLKGGGQITEREGAAATAAIARLNRAQSEAAYRQAISELRAITGIALRRSAGENVPEMGGIGPTPEQIRAMSAQELVTLDRNQLGAEELRALRERFRELLDQQGGQAP